MVLDLCSSSNDTLYLYKVSLIIYIIEGFRVIERALFPYQNFQRDIIPSKSSGNLVLVLCNLTNHALYLYKVS